MLTLIKIKEIKYFKPNKSGNNLGQTEVQEFANSIFPLKSLQNLEVYLEYLKIN